MSVVESIHADLSFYKLGYLAITHLHAGPLPGLASALHALQFSGLGND